MLKLVKVTGHHKARLLTIIKLTHPHQIRYNTSKPE